jgi:hypothetical protein
MEKCHVIWNELNHDRILKNTSIKHFNLCLLNIVKTFFGGDFF